MTQSLTLPVAGLVTDPGPFSAAPEGALLVAQNVAYRRAGVIEPRAKFVRTDDSTRSGLYDPQFCTNHFDGSSSAIYEVLSESGTTHVRRDATTSITAPTISGWSFSSSTTQGESQQGRLFLTSQQGAVSIDSNTATTARLAGMPRGNAPLVQLSTTGTLGKWLATNYATSYKICFARDAASSLLVGAPSDTLIQRNNTGSSVYTTVRVFIPGEIIAGDYVQIYRSFKVTPYTATPAEDFRLRATLTVTSTDVSNGYVDFTDALDDAEWSGPSLYTNAGQDGALLANFRPYYARDVKLYNGMMFYAGYYTPPRVTINVKSIGRVNVSDLSQTLNSIKVQLAANATIGATVLSYSTAPGGDLETSALAVGQIVTADVTGRPGNADAQFSADTRIVSINKAAGTLTLSKPILANIASGTPVVYWDWVNVNTGGVDYKVYPNYSTLSGAAGNMGSYLPTSFPKVFGIADSDGGTALTSFFAGGAPDMERAWSQTNESASGVRLYTFETGQGAYKGVTLIFEAVNSLSTTSFSVTTTKPGAFEQTISTTTSVASEREGFAGRLAWSKLDQPDAVPVGYFQDIGDRNQPIFRVMPTQDALWVFKGDGVFRLYGRVPDNLTVDPIDPTARLSSTAPQWVTKYGDTVYAWTTRGVVECGNFGVRNVDDGIRQYMQSIVQNSMSAVGPWSSSSSYNRCIWFGAVAMGANSNLAFVYYPELRQWATWTIPFDIQAANVGFQNAPIFSARLGYAQYVDDEYEIRNATIAPSYDDPQVVLHITAIAGTLVSYTVTSGTYSPNQGDAIFGEDAVAYYVQSAPAPGQFVLDRVPLFSVGSNANPAIAFYTTVQWLARAEGNPASVKHWQNVTFAFDRLRGGTKYAATFQGYQSNVAPETTVTYEPNASAPVYTSFVPYTRRSAVPTSMSRDWAFRPGFKFTQAGAWFTTATLGVEYDYVGPRIGKAVPLG